MDPTIPNNDREQRRLAALDALVEQGWIASSERERYGDMARAMVEVVCDHGGGMAEILLVLARSGIEIKGRGAGGDNVVPIVAAIRGGEPS